MNHQPRIDIISQFAHSITIKAKFSFLIWLMSIHVLASKQLSSRVKQTISPVTIQH